MKSRNLTRQQRRYVELMRTANAALRTIVDDILDLSKVEAGRLELDRRGFSPTTLVHDTLEIANVVAAAKSLRLKYTVDRGVPDRLVGDDARLRQILLNLVNNAIKFTATGSISVEVRKEPATDGRERIRFAVHDTGIGIPREQQPRLFQAFSQADQTISRGYGGTGLGLAICKRLVELMEGEIGVVSESGEGATVWFTAHLPALAQTEPAPEEPAELADGEASKARILVVDDLDTNREIVEAYLDERGYQVDTVGSAIDALQMLGRRDLRSDPDGRPDARDGWRRRDKAHPRLAQTDLQRSDRRHDRQRPAASGQVVPRRRHERSRRQADRTRQAPQHCSSLATQDGARGRPRRAKRPSRNSTARNSTSSSASSAPKGPHGSRPPSATIWPPPSSRTARWRRRSTTRMVSSIARACSGSTGSSAPAARSNTSSPPTRTSSGRRSRKSGLRRGSPARPSPINCCPDCARCRFDRRDDEGASALCRIRGTVARPRFPRANSRLEGETSHVEKVMDQIQVKRPRVGTAIQHLNIELLVLADGVAPRGARLPNDWAPAGGRLAIAGLGRVSELARRELLAVTERGGELRLGSKSDIGRDFRHRASPSWQEAPWLYPCGGPVRTGTALFRRTSEHAAEVRAAEDRRWRRVRATKSGAGCCLRYACEAAIPPGAKTCRRPGNDGLDPNSA